MGKVTLRPDLNEVVARMIVPNVAAVARETMDLAKRNAPATKKWVTFGDGKVRKSHRHADQQEIPANLRFTLDAFEWDVKHPQAGGVRETFEQHTAEGNNGGDRGKYLPGAHSYLLAPRDRTGEHYVQIFACRCALAIDPFGVAKLVKRTATIAKGTKVKATVYAQGEYVIGAELGDTYPRPSGGEFVEDGTYFMRNTAAQMNARLMGARIT